MNTSHHKTGRKPFYLVAIFAALVVFFSADLIESFWLTELDESTSHLLRELRAITTCLILTGVVIAAAYRRHPSPFPFQQSTAKSLPGGHLMHLAEWFLWLRWLACASAAILVLVTIEIIHLLPTILLLPLLGWVLFLAVSNLGFGKILLRSPSSVDKQVTIQVFTDLITLTALLHFSGGIENPLSLLYLFHVIIAGIFFNRRRCYYVAWIAFLLFGAMAALEFLEYIPHYTLEIFPHTEEHGSISSEQIHASHHGPYVISRILLQGLILLITGYFITTIMDRLRRREIDARDLAVRESEARERLESVVDTAGAGLRLLDSKLESTWTNAKFHLWAPSEKASLSVAEKTLHDGKTRSTEHTVLTSDGRNHYYATTTAAMIGDRKKPHHVVQLVQDISARKDAEAEAVHAGKLAAVGELAGNLAHEINNPLGILNARLHLLLKGRESLPAKAQSDLEKMAGLVDRITGITRSMLGHVRPSNRMRESVEVGPLLDRVEILTESMAKRKSVHIQFQIDPLTPKVHANPGELEQVIVNLILNAVDASPPGRVVRVETGPAKSDDLNGQQFRLSVEDEGPGIPDLIRHRIFDAFFSTKKTGEGTGLGLSLSLRIVKEHGGTLSEEPGVVGAKFVMVIPVNPPETA